MNDKVCKKCGVSKPICEFDKYPGQQAWRATCFSCRRLEIETDIKNHSLHAEIVIKKCSRCLLDKSLNEYYEDLWGKLGRESSCSTCRKSTQQSLNKQNKSTEKHNREEKSCSSCGLIKGVKNFHRKNTTKDGLSTICKKCKFKQPKITPPSSKLCVCCLVEKKISLFSKNYLNKDGFRNSCKDCQAQYQDANRKKISAQEKAKRRTDIQFKLKKLLRNRLLAVVKKGRKSAKTLDLLGCDVGFLKNYLEGLFEPRMSWSNHGNDGWNIDHISPCDSFDLSGLEGQKKCFHYSNLMPRWATTEIAIRHGSAQIGNMNKGNRTLDFTDPSKNSEQLNFVESLYYSPPHLYLM